MPRSGKLVRISLVVAAVAAVTALGVTTAGAASGKTTRWNDSAIKKLNRGKSLPSTAITVVHRSDSSGTSYNFTDYLAHVSGGWKSQVGTGTSVSWPTGVGVGHSSGVAAAVKSTQ